MAHSRDDIHFTSRRPTVVVQNGAVGCAQPLAANIGIGNVKISRNMGQMVSDYKNIIKGLSA